MNRELTKTYAAFTLIELLVVLSISVSLFYLSSVSFTRAKSEIETYRFFSRFEREIKVTQMTALVQGNPTFLLISNNQIYFSREKTTQLIVPEKVNVKNKGQIMIKFSIYTGFSASTEEIVFEWMEGKELKKRNYTFKLGGGIFVY